jgi:hypothetical protein
MPELPKVRERTYNVMHGFYSENPNVMIGIGDIIYTNVGDNNFYFEKAEIVHMLDWSLAMKATRYGWIELLKVESAE